MTHKNRRLSIDVSFKLFLMIILATALSVPMASADKLTVKGLYIPPQTWYTLISGTVLVSDGFGGYTLKDFRLNDAYQVKSATGLGLEYEFKKPSSWFGLAFGIDHYFPRAFDSTRQTATVGGHTATTEISLTDMSYQVTYYYGKLKSYINDNWYIGTIVQVPTTVLSGAGWQDWFGPEVEVVTYAGYGLISGIYLNDFALELSYIYEKITFKHIADGSDNGFSTNVDRAPNSVLSLINVSCGYYFDLFNAPKTAIAEERGRTPAKLETQDIFKETPKESGEQTIPATSNADIQPVAFPSATTGNESEAPMNIF
jgi:hypothetical protein